MANLKCKTIKISKDINETPAVFAQEIFPLMEKYWAQHGSKLYLGAQLAPNMLAMIEMLANGGLVPIVVYEEVEQEVKGIKATTQKPIGFAILLKFRPLTHQRNIVQMDVWYSDTDEGYIKLQEYLTDVFEILQVEEVQIPRYPDHYNLEIRGLKVISETMDRIIL